MAPGVSSREDLQRRVRRLEGLPSMPGALQEIWRAVRNPTCSAARLSDAVSTDPGLTARLIRMANSAYFGLNRPVSDVREAVVVLGFEVVKSMAIGASVVDAFQSLGKDFDMTRFWRHSVSTGIAAEQVALAMGGVKPEVAFCGGVLHDVGKLALVTVIGADYRRAFDGADPGMNAVDAEEAALGVDHATAGKWLGQKWKFSEELIDVIACHHRPELAGERRRLVTAVALGEGLLPEEDPASLEADRTPLRPEWLEELGGDEANVEMIRTRIGDRIRNSGPMAAF